MGNGSSDWEGVRWEYDTLDYDTTTSAPVYELLPCSLENGNISNPVGNERDNSDFTGVIEPTNGLITIMRQTLDSE